MSKVIFINWLISLWPIFLLIFLWWLPALAALGRLRQNNFEENSRRLLGLIILLVPLAGVIAYLALSRRG